MAVLIALVLIALVVTAVVCMLRKAALPTQGAVRPGMVYLVMEDGGSAEKVHKVRRSNFL